MERGVTVVDRYCLPEGYRVDVVREETQFSGECDYWLCDSNNHMKVLLFSQRFRDKEQELRTVLTYAEAYLRPRMNR